MDRHLIANGHRNRQWSSTQRILVNADPKDFTWEASRGISFSKTIQRPSSILNQEQGLAQGSPDSPRNQPAAAPQTLTQGEPNNPFQHPGYSAPKPIYEDLRPVEKRVANKDYYKASKIEDSDQSPVMPGTFPGASRQGIAAFSRRQYAIAAPHQKKFSPSFAPDAAYRIAGTFRSSSPSPSVQHTAVKLTNGRPSLEKSLAISKVEDSSTRRSLVSGLFSSLGALVGRPGNPLSIADGSIQDQENDKQESTQEPPENDDEIQPSRKLELPPSHGPKGYHIPPETVTKLEKEAKMHSLYWQSSWYRSLEDQKVIVHYCKSLEKSEEVAKMFLDNDVLGFDVEWKPNCRTADGIRKNVSLVQIANEERVALFHIARFGKGETEADLVPPTLKIIMESADISKVGVSVRSDCTRMRTHMGIKSQGQFELSHMHTLVQYSKGQIKCLNKRLVSLSKQAQEHLGAPLRKGKVRSSDWSQDLNMEQVQYAANDSYAGLQIFYTLDAKRLALENAPPRPAHAELELPIRLTTGDTHETNDEQSAPTNDDQSVSLSEDESMSASDGSSREDSSQPLSQVSIEAPKRPVAVRAPKKAEPSQPTLKPEVEAANEWIALWRSRQPIDSKAKAYPAALKAYALWHVQGCDCTTAAALLRDPPLKQTSVATYILDAIMLENLPYDPEKVSDVTLNLPDVLRTKSRRYFQRKGDQPLTIIDYGA